MQCSLTNSALAFNVSAVLSQSAFLQRVDLGMTLLVYCFCLSSPLHAHHEGAHGEDHAEDVHVVWSQVVGVGVAISGVRVAVGIVGRDFHHCRWDYWL